MRSQLAILTIILIAAINFSKSEARAEQTSNPTKVIDLSYFPFETDLYKFNSDWTFYYGQLLEPETLIDGENPIQIPFELFIPASLNLGEEKHGTFVTRILLDRPIDHYTIHFPPIRAAAKIWINGQLIRKIGVVGSSRDQEKALIQPFTLDLFGDSSELELVVQISSYSILELGANRPVLLGKPTLIYQHHRPIMILESFAGGAILIMAFYHFSLFLLRRERKAPLWFAIFCTLVAIRTFVASDGNILYLAFPEPNYEFRIKLEYWTFNLGVASCSIFVYMLYSRDVSRIVLMTMATVSVAYAILVLFTNNIIYAQLLPPFQIFTLSGSAIVLAGIVLSVFRRRSGSLLFMFGFMAMISAVVNDISVSRGLIKGPILIHVGQFVFILFQAIILSKRFSRAFSKVEEARAEIRQLNEGLEKKVQERTQTIRIILDNVKAGFLLINRKIQVEEGFTRSCPELLGREMRAGQSFLELFDLSSSQFERLDLAISQAFDDMMPEEATISQIPSRLKVGNKVMALQGSVVRDDKRKVRSILFTLTDATELVQAESDSRLNQCLLRIMQDKPAFEGLVTESFASISAAIQSINMPDQVRIILHTLKGNFASFGLENLVNLIHEIEANREISVAHLNMIEAAIQAFISQYEDALGEKSQIDKERYFYLREENITLLRSRLKTASASPEVIRLFEKWIVEVKQVPIQQLLGPMIRSASRIAKKLGKEVELQINGGNTMVEAERVSGLIQNLVHLIRNSIDHGIEYPEEREDKPSQGRIEVSVDSTPHELRFSVSDDGRGIDLEKIQSQAIKQGLILTEGEYSPQQLLDLIFQAGFSTKTEASNISGRGIGLSSLKRSIEELNGRIEVTSSPGLGSRFVITIPAREHSGLSASKSA